MMKKLTKILIGVVGGITLAVQSPGVQQAAASAIQHVLVAHPNLSALFMGIGAILALVHDPKSSN